MLKRRGKLLIFLLFLLVAIFFLLKFRKSSSAHYDVLTYDVSELENQENSYIIDHRPRAKPKADLEHKKCQNVYQRRLRWGPISSEDKSVCLSIESQRSKLPLLKQTKHDFGGNKIDKITMTREVTLVSQLSCNRLNMMLSLLENWQGPASMAVYCNNITETEHFIQTMKNYQYVHHIRLVLVSAPTDVVLDDSSTFPFLYPINYLRNVALNNSATQYVFLNDLDFIPSHGLHNYLLKATSELLSVPKRALVVAAFEEKEKFGDYPSNKDQLKTLYDREIVTRFHTHFPGHLPTNYTVWFKESSPYRINWKRDYEPYVVVNKSNLPALYDESFVGYGFNKLVFIAELQAAQFEFIVLPKEFLIHRIHPKSKNKNLIDNNEHVRKCMKYKYMQFLWKYLASKYRCGWDAN